jgi:hypothetical protein
VRFRSEEEVVQKEAVDGWLVVGLVWIVVVMLLALLLMNFKLSRGIPFAFMLKIPPFPMLWLALAYGMTQESGALLTSLPDGRYCIS